MGANQSFVNRSSGAWTTYKIALLCLMVCALSGCGKWVQIHFDKVYSEMRDCTALQGPESPPPRVDSGDWDKFFWNQSFERLVQCVTGPVNDFVRSSGKNKRAALEHHGFTCPKSKEDECFWTVTSSRYGLYEDEEKEGIEYTLTKIIVNLKRNTITITRSTAFEDGHYRTLYSLYGPFQ